MSDNRLKITKKNLIRNWNYFFLVFLLFIFAGTHFYITHGFKGFFVFPLYLFIQFGVTAYLSIRYYHENREEEYYIQPDGIRRVKNGNEELFHSSQISKIVVCKSANMDNWGLPLTTFESFRLAKVYLKNRQILILTNLLEYDIEVPLKILENVKFERRKGFSFFI